MWKTRGLICFCIVLTLLLMGSAMAITERTVMPDGGEISLGVLYHFEGGPLGLFQAIYLRYSFDAIESGTYSFCLIPIEGVTRERITIEDRYHEKPLNAEGYGDSLICSVNLEENETYQLELYVEGFYGNSVYLDFAICSPFKHALLNETEVFENATCTKDGYSGQICGVCGEVVNQEVIPATGHMPGQWQIISEPTCKEPGAHELCCTVCGEVLESEEIPALGHTPGEWVQTNEPTCLKNGKRHQRCTVCGVILNSEDIPVLEHIPGEWEVQKPATCTTAGKRIQRCTNCKKELASEEILATGHTPGEEEIITSATCIQPGIKGTRCITCGEVLSTEELPKCDHTYGTMQIVKPATCTTDGYNEQRCTVCGVLLNSETTPAVGHTPGTWATVMSATCLNDGYKAIVCVSCGLELETETLPALGHDEGIWITVKEPTRVENGLRELRCSRCGAVLDSEILPAYLDDKTQMTPEELITLLNQSLKENMELVSEPIDKQYFLQGDESAVAYMRINGAYAGDFALYKDGYRVIKRIDSIAFDEDLCHLYVVAAHVLKDMDEKEADELYREQYAEFVNEYVYGAGWPRYVQSDEPVEHYMGLTGEKGTAEFFWANMGHLDI